VVRIRMDTRATRPASRPTTHTAPGSHIPTATARAAHGLAVANAPAARVRVARVRAVNAPADHGLPVRVAPSRAAAARAVAGAAKSRRARSRELQRRWSGLGRDCVSTTQPAPAESQSIRTQARSHIRPDRPWERPWPRLLLHDPARRCREPRHSRASALPHQAGPTVGAALAATAFARSGSPLQGAKGFARERAPTSSLSDCGSYLGRDNQTSDTAGNALDLGHRPAPVDFRLVGS
jgi:hypothetical protein